jgi:hypothetical protein
MCRAAAILHPSMPQLAGAQTTPKADASVVESTIERRES